MGPVRYSNDKTRIGFDKYNPSTSQIKYVFVKPQKIENTTPKAQNSMSRNSKVKNPIPKKIKKKK